MIHFRKSRWRYFFLLVATRKKFAQHESEACNEWSLLLIKNWLDPTNKWCTICRCFCQFYHRRGQIVPVCLLQQQQKIINKWNHHEWHFYFNSIFTREFFWLFYWKMIAIYWKINFSSDRFINYVDWRNQIIIVNIVNIGFQLNCLHFFQQKIFHIKNCIFGPKWNIVDARKMSMKIFWTSNKFHIFVWMQFPWKNPVFQSINAIMCLWINDDV